MNGIVISLVPTGNCRVCGDETRMRISVADPRVPGPALTGWVDCPLCSNAGSLVSWLAPFVEDEPPGVIA